MRRDRDVLDKNDVVSRSSGSNETGVSLEVEIEGERVGDALVDNETSGEV
jgi:hypothetical protein